MEFEGGGIRPYAPVIGNEIVQHVALPLIPLSVLMLLFNIVAVRRVLRPLRRAESEVDALDPENGLTRLSEPPSPREVVTLVSAVNRALDRLEATMGTLRLFTANAAHELRTPLSIMQMALMQLPPGKERDALRNDTEMMIRLVGQLLDLTQAESLVVEADQRVDLAGVGREIVAELTPKAYAMDREIRFTDLGAATIAGHREAIVRIYRNLIENALSHAPGPTPIEVVVGPGPQISVRDHGKGIEESDLAFIFDRAC
ncbi:Signal transduction histidine kinase [Thioclava dalianensis]|nr:Signal transduction histidine kinase [Thioclava dalianensis]